MSYLKKYYILWFDINGLDKVKKSIYSIYYVFSYHIPADSEIIANFWAVHQNAAHFPQPNKFNPDRFINADGKIFKPDQLMAFSIGND